jgi:phytoene synthase
VRALIEYEVARARGHYAAAAPGVPLLAATSQACVRAAYHLYAGILDEVERAGHDVFARRVVVPTSRRLGTAMRCLLTPAGTPVASPERIF